MKDSIFRKKDFILCDVPVPVGYPQSQTHCEVLPFRDKIVLSTSPFPEERNMRKRAINKILRKITGGRWGKLIRSEAYENPCLYISNSNANSYPTSFTPMTDNPLVNEPEKYNGIHSFNSDPQVFLDNEKLCVFNRVIRREQNRGGDPGNFHYLTDIYKIEGVEDKERFYINSVSLFRKFTEPCISPSVIHFRNAYYFVYLDSYSYNDGETFNGMYLIKSTSLDGLKTEESVKKINVQCPEGILPWHFSLFQYVGKLYAVVACVEKGKKNRCIQMLGVFDDNVSTLSVFKTPLTNVSSYRGCGFVDASGIFVLYNTTVNEYFKHDKSVDGRNVVMARLDFNTLLNRIR